MCASILAAKHISCVKPWFLWMPMSKKLSHDQYQNCSINTCTRTMYAPLTMLHNPAPPACTSRLIKVNAYSWHRNLFMNTEYFLVQSSTPTYYVCLEWQSTSRYFRVLTSAISGTYTGLHDSFYSQYQLAPVSIGPELDCWRYVLDVKEYFNVSMMRRKVRTTDLSLIDINIRLCVTLNGWIM